MVDFIVQTSNLCKYYYEESRLPFLSFGKKSRHVKAVDNISLGIERNEVLGLVGESGCGKSTLGKTIIRLEEPTSGTIFFEDQDITNLSMEQIKPLRRKMQIILQDPYASLNPRKTVFQIVSQPLELHWPDSKKKERMERVEELIDKVGLEKNQLKRYPHQFSGGQRQRICIARAISFDPIFLVADEVVSALDVSVQAQILNLLLFLKRDLNLSILFISHDLSVVRQICDRVAVMYLGRIVETASSDELFNNPLHPYTQALMSAIPIPDVEKKWEPILLRGEPPNPSLRPAGCYFHPRCHKVLGICKKQYVTLNEVNSRHFVACHLFESKPLNQDAGL